MQKEHILPKCVELSFLYRYVLSELEAFKLSYSVLNDIIMPLSAPNWSLGGV
jgi:hypothetical protein